LIAADIERTLHGVYVRIHRARMSVSPQASLLLQHQTATKSMLVDPVVRALEWGRGGPGTVHREFKLKRRAKPVDYAMFLSEDPYMLLEVCPLGTELMALGLTSRIMRRAVEGGFPWVVLTNGDEYRIYNAVAFGPSETEPFRSVRVTGAGSREVWDVLVLLSVGQAGSGAIEQAWELSRRDRLVRAAIEGFMSSDCVAAVIEEHLQDLSHDEICDSLSRARISVEFDTMGRLADAGGEKTGRQRRMQEVELQIATWLQQRAMDRWAVGQRRGARLSRLRQRRGRPGRRIAPDRRSIRADRRRMAVEVTADRRSGAERRVDQRRSDPERRSVVDRRRATSVS
jgi:hypothetical protein